jgi:hypothetical protein
VKAIEAGLTAGRASADANNGRIPCATPTTKFALIARALSVRAVLHSGILLKDSFSHRFIPFLSQGQMRPYYSRVTSSGRQATALCLSNGIQLALRIVDTFSKSQFAARDAEFGARFCEILTPL